MPDVDQDARALLDAQLPAASSVLRELRRAGHRRSRQAAVSLMLPLWVHQSLGTAPGADGQFRSGHLSDRLTGLDHKLNGLGLAG